MDQDDEAARTASFIGIVVAISGNILISVALNCQKLAHKRLQLESQKVGTPSPRPSPLNVPDELPLQRYSSPNGKSTTLDSTTPLRGKNPFPRYGSSPLPSRLALSGQAGGTLPVAIPEDNENSNPVVIGVVDVTSPSESQSQTNGEPAQYSDDGHPSSENGETFHADESSPKEGAYLKSKLW